MKDVFKWICRCLQGEQKAGLQKDEQQNSLACAGLNGIDGGGRVADAGRAGAVDGGSTTRDTGGGRGVGLGGDDLGEGVRGAGGGNTGAGAGLTRVGHGRDIDGGIADL